jgi:hypothetical protein
VWLEQGLLRVKELLRARLCQMLSSNRFSLSIHGFLPLF